jgi:hypothetical protein
MRDTIQHGVQKTSPKMFKTAIEQLQTALEDGAKNNILVRQKAATERVFRNTDFHCQNLAGQKKTPVKSKEDGRLLATTVADIDAAMR